MHLGFPKDLPRSENFVYRVVARIKIKLAIFQL